MSKDKLVKQFLANIMRDRRIKRLLDKGIFDRSKLHKPPPKARAIVMGVTIPPLGTPAMAVKTKASKASEAAKKAWVTRRKNASEAAKKAWVTRRKNAAEAEKEDPVQAEAERQEALRILDELAKNRPPETT